MQQRGQILITFQKRQNCRDGEQGLGMGRVDDYKGATRGKFWGSDGTILFLMVVITWLHAFVKTYRLVLHKKWILKKVNLTVYKFLNKKFLSSRTFSKSTVVLSVFLSISNCPKTE